MVSGHDVVLVASSQAQRQRASTAWRDGWWAARRRAPAVVLTLFCRAWCGPRLLLVECTIDLRHARAFFWHVLWCTCAHKDLYKMKPHATGSGKRQSSVLCMAPPCGLRHDELRAAELKMVARA
jgi:hypothetical protein